jgi:hypothetical protein
VQHTGYYLRDLGPDEPGLDDIDEELLHLLLIQLQGLLHLLQPASRTSM